ncbi:QVR superfamily protein rtv isoform X2 [Lycorma delicatula]|uniref:QVR superfamily protein rtv isoform X2 n=1 Tax=Lycorma delicatula TaxID=130591 RepID=UPI003F510122
MSTAMDWSSKFLTYLLIAFYIILLSSPNSVEGVLKRCFQCRSRGELGNCKDPFAYNNATAIEKVPGIQAVPCASGWCGKILEGGANQFKDEEYGVATERLCLQRGPSDNEERCAPAAWGNSKVQMCFCQGDLCNSATKITKDVVYFIVVLLLFGFCSLFQ